MGRGERPDGGERIESGNRPDGREPIDLRGESRRQFLRALAVAGAGPAGLRDAVEHVHEDVPAGRPVVWTRDRRGRPERVRVVGKERHRRLDVYGALDVERLRDRHPGVDGVSLSTSSGLPVLRVLVDRLGWSARRSLPSRVRRVPVVLDERDDRDPDLAEPSDCGTLCHEHVVRFYDPLPAGVQVKGRHRGAVTRDGTLGLVAWNGDPRDGYECLVTAHHVVALEGEREVGAETPAARGDGTAEFLFQSGLDDGEPRAEDVGRLRATSPLSPTGLDVAKYELAGGVDAAPLQSAGYQPRVSGSWDFAGLADATAAPDDSVPVTFSGRSTCWAESRCTGTERDHVVQYEAVVDPAVADAGDSGGPWLDADGKLVCTLATGPACDGVDDHHGPVGTALLDRLGVSLHPPNVGRSG